MSNNKVDKYIARQVKRGFPLRKIKAALLESGNPEHIVEEAARIVIQNKSSQDVS